MSPKFAYFLPGSHVFLRRQSSLFEFTFFGAAWVIHVNLRKPSFVALGQLGSQVIDHREAFQSARWI